MTPDFTQEQIVEACQAYGTHVGPLPEGIDGTQLLWAISGNESSFGYNCTPRYEHAFDTGGPYAIPTLLTRYGRPAACSHGPWQIMFANCPPDYTPDDMSNLDMAAQATVQFLNHQLNRFKPSTLSTIASIWNGGNPHAVVPSYAAELEKNYLVPLPGAAFGAGSTP